MSAAGKNRAGELLAWFGFLALLGAAYLPFLGAAGVIDGEMAIYSHLRRAPTAFDFTVFPVMRSAAFRPTLELVVRLEYGLVGFDPSWFTVTNLLALLLLLVLLARFADRAIDGSGSPLALLVIAGLNYFNHELMGWHIILADILAAGSQVAVLILFQRNTWPAYGLSLMALLVGIGAKETAFLTPVLVAGFWGLGCCRRPVARPGLKLVGYFLIVGIYLVGYFGYGDRGILRQDWGFYSEFKAGRERGSDYPRWYAGNLARGVASLLNSYALSPVRDRLSPSACIPLVILLVGLTGPRRRLVWFGILAALGSVLPFGSFDLAAPAADRYLVPANLWLAIGLAAGLRDLAARLRPGRFLVRSVVLGWGIGAATWILSAPDTVAYPRAYRQAGEEIARFADRLPGQTIYLDRRLTPRFNDDKGHMVLPDHFAAIYLPRSRFISRPELAVGPLAVAVPGPEEWVMVPAAMAGAETPARFRIAGREFGLARAGGRALPPTAPGPEPFGTDAGPRRESMVYSDYEDNPPPPAH